MFAIVDRFNETALVKVLMELLELVTEMHGTCVLVDFGGNRIRFHSDLEFGSLGRGSPFQEFVKAFKLAYLLIKDLL